MEQKDNCSIYAQTDSGWLALSSGHQWSVNEAGEWNFELADLVPDTNSTNESFTAIYYDALGQVVMTNQDTYVGLYLGTPMTVAIIDETTPTASPTFITPSNRDVIRLRGQVDPSVVKLVQVCQLSDVENCATLTAEEVNGDWAFDWTAN